MKHCGPAAMERYAWLCLASTLINVALVLYATYSLQIWANQNQGNLEDHKLVDSLKSSTARFTGKRRWKRDVSSAVEVPCVKRSKRDLMFMLGEAYNPRYMSIEKPPDFEELETPEEELADPYPLHIRPNYTEIFPNDGELENYLLKDLIGADSKAADAIFTSAYRTKRAATKLPFSFPPPPKVPPWQCEWRIRWTDLGQDYFPRFMRNVECSANSCWFGKLPCRPKAFGVIVLRRRRTLCSLPVDDPLPLTTVENSPNKLPADLVEDWTFEEHAITFCCECIFKET